MVHAGDFHQVFSSFTVFLLLFFVPGKLQSLGFCCFSLFPARAVKQPPKFQIRGGPGGVASFAGGGVMGTFAPISDLHQKRANCHERALSAAAALEEGGCRLGVEPLDTTTIAFPTGTRPTSLTGATSAPDRNTF